MKQHNGIMFLYFYFVLVNFPLRYFPWLIVKSPFGGVYIFRKNACSFQLVILMNVIFYKEPDLDGTTYPYSAKVVSWLIASFPMSAMVLNAFYEFCYVGGGYNVSYDYLIWRGYFCFAPSHGYAFHRLYMSAMVFKAFYKFCYVGGGIDVTYGQF